MAKNTLQSSLSLKIMNNDKFFEHSLTRTKRAFASQGQGKEEEKQERKKKDGKIKNNKKSKI